MPMVPLQGFRFLELGDDRAGAYAGRLLVLLGAHVVKVRSPDGRTAPGTEGGWLDAGKVIVDRSQPLASLDRTSWAGVLDGTDVGSGSPPCPLVRIEPTRSAAEDWARSGAMALTGAPEGDPLVAPGSVATAMRGAAAAFELLTACRGAPCRLDGPALLAERAALLGLTGRGGTVSASGSSHLLEAADGWLAVGLHRTSDLELVPAWLEVGDLGWDELRSQVRRHPVGWLVERAQLLGLPASEVGPPSGGTDEQLEARGQLWPPAPWLLDGRSLLPTPLPPGAPVPPGPTQRRDPFPVVARRAPLVVDLTALWAGPLAGSLLAMAGCRVVKVEDPARPDTTRWWSPRLFDLLNAGKQSVAVPFTPGGSLAELIASADVVLEASRPRAMEQLGIEPRADQLWVSITGYGRSGPWRQRVALGDDAAAAAGLVVRGPGGDRPFFCGDAAADPVTGLHAAVALLGGIIGGATGTIDLAMREVVGHAIGPTAGAANRDLDVFRVAGAVAPPRARPVCGPGPELGRDTEAVLRSL